jgi:hypothetical protein
MSSDSNNDFADEYPAGAIADSPVPLSHEFPIDTPVHIQAPIPVVDFTTLQPLSIAAPMLRFAKRCPTWTKVMWMQPLTT